MEAIARHTLSVDVARLLKVDGAIVRHSRHGISGMTGYLLHS
jgi:hypothetical protein